MKSWRSREDFPWQRLSAVDASNLSLEHAGQAYTIGLVGILEAGTLATDDGSPDLERFRALLAPRVLAVPRLCQKVHATRWGQGLPVWVDCAVDLGAHIRSGTRVEGQDVLDSLCGRLLATPLPRDRPLWDLLVVPGPVPDHLAIVLRLHHAVADGVAAVDVVRALFDSPSASWQAGSDVLEPRSAQRPPTGRELRVDAFRIRLSRVSRGVKLARGWPAKIRGIVKAVPRVTAIFRLGLPPTSLLGPVGRRRQVVVASADLGPIQSTAQAAGATVNDVLLAAVADAARALLAARGEDAVAELRVSVPVSLRTDSPAVTTTGNRVGVMVVRLPLREQDSRRRLQRIAAATRTAKWQARAAGPFELTRTRFGTYVLDRASRHQRFIALVVTNVPGPAERLHLGGADMVQAWPLSPIAGNVRIGVAALSYAGCLNTTVVYDVDSTPDAQIFAAALYSGLTQNAV